MVTSKKYKTQGFTLIELILGLSIFSVVMLIVYNAFWGGIRLSERSEQQGEIYREARWTFDLLTKDLEQVASYDFSNSYEGENAFYGEQSKVTFLQVTDQGLKFISYYLITPDTSSIYKVIVGDTYAKNVNIQNLQVEDVKINYLVREEKSFADYLNNRSTKKDDYEVIAMNIKENGLKFSYSYRMGEEDPTIDWKTKWEDKVFPRGVRMEIDFFQPQTNGFITLKREVYIPHGVWEHQDEAG